MAITEPAVALTTTTTTPTAAAVDDLIVATIEADPDLVWDAGAVTEVSGLSMMDCLVALARLTRAGRIARLRPGRYCAAIASSAAATNVVERGLAAR